MQPDSVFITMVLYFEKASFIQIIHAFCKSSILHVFSAGKPKLLHKINQSVRTFFLKTSTFRLSQNNPSD